MSAQSSLTIQIKEAIDRWEEKVGERPRLCYLCPDCYRQVCEEAHRRFIGRLHGLIVAVNMTLNSQKRCLIHNSGLEE